MLCAGKPTQLLKNGQMIVGNLVDNFVRGDIGTLGVSVFEFKVVVVGVFVVGMRVFLEHGGVALESGRLYGVVSLDDHAWVPGVVLVMDISLDLFLFGFVAVYNF